MSIINPVQEAILKELNSLDPRGAIVQIDTVSSTITYNPQIKCHQKPKYEYEGFVRALLVARLVKEYAYPMHAIEIENPLDVNVGRTKRHRGKERGRSDVLVFQQNKGTESLFIGIECKTPGDFEDGKKDLDGQLWGIPKAAEVEKRVGRNINYLALFTVDPMGGQLHDKVLLVDFGVCQTHGEWIKRNRPSSNGIPVAYGDAPQSIFANVAEENAVARPLTRTLSQDDFSKLRERLHNLLWAGSSTDDNAIFYQLVKIFLVKIYDELYTESGESYNFQVRQTSSGEEPLEQLYTRLERLYLAACRELLNYDESRLSEFPFRVEGFTLQKLRVAVRELQSVSLTDNESPDGGFDVLGSFFEGILTNQEFFKQSKGCFFTHQNIVRFMVAMLQLDDLALELLQTTQPRLPYIIDPSCGSGTFLIEAMRYITSCVADRKGEIRFNKISKEFFISAFEHTTKPNIWAADHIYGIEPRPELGLAAKVNMILHGDGNMNIFIQDGLHKFDYAGYSRRWKDKNEGILRSEEKAESPYPRPVNGQFDVVLTNPPFSLETEGLESFDTHPDTFIHYDYTNSENLFLERHYQLLREGGRLAVVLPESVFDTAENQYIRLFILKHFNIDAIVSLPLEAFAPFTTTKTSLLFARKKTAPELDAYEKAWNAALIEYKKLIGLASVKAVLQNERLLNGAAGLIKLCDELDVPLNLENNLLDGAFDEDTRTELDDAISRLPVATPAQIAIAEEKRRRLAAIVEFSDSGVFDKLADHELKGLSRLLRDYYPDECKTPAEVCEAAYDELLVATERNWPYAKDVASFANAWWCLAEVSANSELNYAVFFAEVTEIGYKRTKRREQKRPNELYFSGKGGFPIPVTGSIETVLDRYLRFRAAFR